MFVHLFQQLRLKRKNRALMKKNGSSMEKNGLDSDELPTKNIVRFFYTF